MGVIASFLFPGLGQGLATHRLRMVVWMVAVLASMLLIVVSVWFVPLSLLLRVGCAVDASWCLRRAAHQKHYVNAAIALVVGAVGFGCVKLAIEGFKIPSSSMYPTLIIGDHVFVDKLSVKWRAPERGEVVVFTQPCSLRTFVKRVIARGGDTIEVRCSQVYVNGQPATSTLVAPSASYRDRDENGWVARKTSRYRETVGGRAYDTFHAPERPTRPDAAAHGDFPSRMFAPSCTQGSGFFDQKPGAPTQPTGRIVETKPAASPCEMQLHFEVPAGTLFMMGDNRNNANDSRYWGVVREDAVIGRVTGIWMSDGIEGGWSRFGAIH